MALLQPAAVVSCSSQITVTGATAVGTLIFDGTISGDGTSGNWIVDIFNMDADTGDTLFIGFTAATATVAAGVPVGIFSETTSAHAYRVIVPAHAKIYANCTDGETRDVRLAAYPLLA
jgi:hypothetical protein